MAAVPATSNPLGTTTTQDLLQLAYLLNGAYSNAQSLGNANAVARDAAANYTGRYNATETAADQYLKLLQAISPALAQSADADSTDLVNRTNQIFSALVPTVDRANAMTASQGFAKALKNGMGDSTQAMDNANTLSRNFGDVYAKLQETARQRAFDELKASIQAKQQTASMATQGLANLNSQALNAARQTASDAATRAATAQTAVGSNLEKLITSKAADWLTGTVEKKLNENGGFTGLLKTLQGAFSDDTTKVGPESPILWSAGNPVTTGSAPSTSSSDYQWGANPDAFYSAPDEYTPSFNVSEYNYDPSSEGTASSADPMWWFY